MRRVLWLLVLCAVAGGGAQTRREESTPRSQPGSRSVMDAHNCYPYGEWWGDRIDRALSAGTPLAIEQDLYWYTDAKTGQSRSLLAHGAPVNGDEPRGWSSTFSTGCGRWWSGRCGRAITETGR